MCNKPTGFVQINFVKKEKKPKQTNKKLKETKNTHHQEARGLA